MGNLVCLHSQAMEVQHPSPAAPPDDLVLRLETAQQELVRTKSDLATLQDTIASLKSPAVREPLPVSSLLRLYVLFVCLPCPPPLPLARAPVWDVLRLCLCGLF